MSELIPVGIFELFIFRQSDDPSKYAVQIVVPNELRTNAESWIEAAACLTAYAARHSNLGYEMMLETITARSMSYRDVSPDSLDHPEFDPDLEDEDPSLNGPAFST